MSLTRFIAGGVGLALALAANASAQSSGAPAQKAHRCAPAALAQAPRLLAFHFGPDSRIEIDKSVRVLASIRNPANSTQRFDVLEVLGHVYKGDYRMRFIYARVPGECLLMGQEVLELASL
jgi:hypothetical protein